MGPPAVVESIGIDADTTLTGVATGSTFSARGKYDAAVTARDVLTANSGAYNNA